MFAWNGCDRLFATRNEAYSHMDADNHWEPPVYGREQWYNTFRTWDDCFQHMRDTGHWDEGFACDTCERTFRTKEACLQHMQAKGHGHEGYGCDTCERTFRTQEACDQHMNDTGHWEESYECETCEKTFTTLDGAEQHMRALGHWAPKVPCQMCSKKFRTQHEADQHMSDTGHWAPRFPCETCGKMFYSENSAEQHMEALGHWANYCSECDRHFANANNFRIVRTPYPLNPLILTLIGQHLNSRTHRGKTVTCPFCKLNYTSASGLTAHLEAGSCTNAPGANRGTIHLMIRERDPNGAITRKEIDHDNLCIRYTANHRAYNGCAWECYMCHSEFSTVEQLNNHLNSPVHKEKIYHCPNKKCRREFSTLAALFNHLESETCAFIRFEKVQGAVGDVLKGKMITFG